MNKVFKIENIYLMVAIIIGIVFVFLIPPFNSPDEDSHFKRSYSISDFDLYPIDNGENIGNYFPKNILKYINKKQSYMGDRDTKETYSNMVLETQTLRLSKNKVFNNYSTVAVNPVIYTAPALGMIFTKVTSAFVGADVTITNILYGGRIFSMLFAVIVTFFAIKISPKFKRSMVALALMPMTVFLYSCITYDSVVIPLSFLLFGICTKYIYGKDKKISTFDLVLLAIIAFVYLNIKYVYSLNMLMVLFIPFNKFDLKNKKAIKKYIIIGALFVAAFIITKIPYYSLDMTKYDKTVDIIAAQKKFVLNNPFKYLKIYFNTLFSGRNFYITSFVGILGLIDTYIPIIIIVFYILFLLFTLLVDGSDNDKKVNIIKRILAIVIPFVIISLCFLGMYIIWTSHMIGVKAKTITGVQGRYFIPAFCLLPFAFVNKLKFNKLKDKYDYFVVSFCVGTLLLTTVILLLRFWI